jgi:glycosyltransferase involved in cell wall biosynthesis
VTLDAPRFSILLPTHTRADVLPFAIRSALAQTVSDFELLIAGDGCTDGTAAVVASFADPRIRWFDLPKGMGFGYANRNRALREARGRYIAYLPHDDLWFPDHLERVVARLEDTGADLVHSRLMSVELEGRIRPSAFNLEIPSHQRLLWAGDVGLGMAQVMHTRAAFDAYGWWDETIPRGGDTELWHRIAAGGRFTRVAFMPEPTSLHFVANWRATTGRRRRVRIEEAVAGGLLDELLPDVLYLRTPADQSQQEAMWRRIADDPVGSVRAIRKGVVEYQDALLHKSRTTANLVGLRCGLLIGQMLEAVYSRIRWTASPATRARLTDLRDRTQRIEERQRLESRT